MIKSMTGFGKSEAVCGSKKIVVEIKTLNSKQLDVSMKLPPELRSFEMDYRNEVAQRLQRGKIDVVVNISDTNALRCPKINADVVDGYVKQISSIAEKYEFVDLFPKDWASMLYKMPGVFDMDETALDDNFVAIVKKTVVDTIAVVDDFRTTEGAVLKKDFLKRVDLILNYLTEVETHEDDRHRTIRDRLTKNLSEITTSGQYDENRLEQELIFYLEKLDITEEKVRLRKHCDYFYETIDEEGAGRKLGFISQEMGREINTLGSKANHAEIQRLVVKMKDELEKIKEQLANIL